MDEAAKNAAIIFDELTTKLVDTKQYVPAYCTDIHKKFAETIETMDIVKSGINDNFSKVGEDIVIKLGDSLKIKVPPVSASAKGKALKKQSTAEPRTTISDVTAIKKTTSIMDQHYVKCFTPGDSLLKSKNFSGNKNKLEKQFYKQIKNQENGINDLTVGQYLNNREKYLSLGRDGVSSGSAQRAAGKKLQKKLVDQFKEELIENDIAIGKRATEIAKERANEAMSSLAALHDPDMIAGGFDKISTSVNSGMGNTNINSSLGSQWKGRVSDMDVAAKDALKKYGPDAKMNVSLSRCKT